MSPTRRGLAATALPLLLLGAGMRAAAAKSAGPAPLDACRPGAPLAACVAAKARLMADGGDGAGVCPYCAGLRRGKAGR